MSRISYVDGRFVPHRHAQVAMEDRGYQFADGVYEVIALYKGRQIDAEGHLARLERSLDALSIPMPMQLPALKAVITELVRRNKRRNGLIYMQVTRGRCARQHVPKAHLRPVLTVSINPAKYPDTRIYQEGIRVITTTDIRWARCDIKSIALLANILARSEAAASGAKEAWLMNADGVITEGSLSNAFIVRGGTIFTHPATETILNGITRDVVLSLAAQENITLREEAFTREEAYRADEAFITGASSLVSPVTQIDDRVIGSGVPGPVSLKLAEAYRRHIEADCTAATTTEQKGAA